MTATTEEYIKDQFCKVSHFSFEKKKELSLSQEDIVNDFLDKILSTKKNITDWTDKLEDINNGLEGLTWLNDVKDDDLFQINNVISSVKDLHGVLIKSYVNHNNILRKRGIAKEELNRFKSGIDDLKDIIIDLESIFFRLPAMPEFKETTRILSLL